MDKLTDYKQPSVTVDVIIFSIIDSDLKVLLVKRKNAPFEGRWAIPGGFVRFDENLEDAAKESFQKKQMLKIFTWSSYTLLAKLQETREEG